MAVKVSWGQALAWRMRRQYLDPIGEPSVPEVVRRLCGVQAQVASAAELAVRSRRSTSRAGEVVRALADGRLIKTWAMRGTLHLLTPEDAGAFLSLLAAGRTWERPSWQRYFGMSPAQIDHLGEVVDEALDGRVLTREELVAAVTASPGFEHVGDALRSSWGTLLKPLAWRGILCLGPSRGNRVTFTRPDAASPRWAGVPDADEAAPRAVAAYLSAYGPATADGLGNFVARGWLGLRQVRRWFSQLEDRVTAVEVDGDRAYILTEDLDELAGSRPTDVIRLLAGFDQYVLGPGTDDPRVVPAARRAAVSKQAGWIAPVVVARGVVAGTWALDGDRLQVDWFREAGRPPRAAVDAEIARLATILGRELRPAVKLA